MAKARFIEAHPGIRNLIFLLVGLSILVGIVIRVVMIKPLTNDPLVQAPFLDDGFYYLQIARNVATTGQFTFDGIHPTNGFHPLWELMLVPLAHLSADDFLFIRLVMYLGVVWFGISAILLFKFVTDYGGYFAGLAAVVIWSLSPDLITWQNQGMENTIFLPILIFTLIMIDLYLQSPGSLLRASLLGLSFGILMWSRSDALLFVLLALAGIGIISWRPARSLRTLLNRSIAIILGISLLFGLGYLLFNRFAAGAWLSVSGVVKLGDSSAGLFQFSQLTSALKLHLSMIWGLFSSLGGFTWLRFNWRIYPFKILALAWMVIALVWWGIYLVRNFRNITHTLLETTRIALLLLVIYTLIHSIILVTVMREQLGWTSWYLVPQVLFLSVLLPLIFFSEILIDDLYARLKSWMSRIFSESILKAFYLVACGVLLLSVFGACFWALTVPLNGLNQMVAAQSTLEPRFELATWLKANVPAASQVGMFDAGLAGYFSHVHVVNLDGLVNSPDYVSVRRSGDYADYVIQNHLDYVIQYYYPPYQLAWGKPADDTQVCHQLLHTNHYPAPWGPEKVNNYFEVMALRYDGKCEGSWIPGFPLQAVPPSK